MGKIKDKNFNQPGNKVTGNNAPPKKELTAPNNVCTGFPCLNKMVIDAAKIPILTKTRRDVENETIHPRIFMFEKEYPKNNHDTRNITPMVIREKIKLYIEDMNIIVFGSVCELNKASRQPAICALLIELENVLTAVTK